MAAFMASGEEENGKLRPFEWLTSAESLAAKVGEALQGKTEARVLHVGCGSSILGEVLLERLPEIAQIVNVDIDKSLLKAMKERWASKCSQDQQDKMTFLPVDICREPIPCDDGSFDLVLDKSTLDCLLCSERGASALVSEVHRLLNRQSGVYFLISFHHPDFLLHLLQDAPGSDWNISHSIMYRQVEDLSGSGKGVNLEEVDMPAEGKAESVAWASGAFEPNEVYHRTVSVLVCRKCGNLSNSKLDGEAVFDHVNQCCDRWYQKTNSMLTTERKEQIRQAFEGKLLGLQECHRAIFTDDERENLPFEAFLEDWKDFTRTHPDLVSDGMSSETALLFLAEMQ
jgi:SAM-dependent methyltransferase